MGDGGVVPVSVVIAGGGTLSGVNPSTEAPLSGPTGGNGVDMISHMLRILSRKLQNIVKLCFFAN